MTDSIRRNGPPCWIPTAAAALLVLGCATHGAGNAGEPNGSPLAGPGTILAVGGGGTPPEVLREGLRRARARFGRSPDVVVVPHASGREDRGVGSAEMWREAGAERVEVLADEGRAAAAQLAGAEVVWMIGGDQGRLLEHLRAEGLVDDVLDAHRRGAVVGGTSAGAAVLGTVTIAGAPEPGPYRAGAMAGEPGLGLVDGAVVDQHFAERRREGRLLTSIAGGAAPLGVGVGERTCALFEGGGFEVLGEGSVLVVDGRAARGASPAPGELLSARGLAVHVLRAGDAWAPGEAGSGPAPGR